jgi:hypothetical protein
MGPSNRRYYRTVFPRRHREINRGGGLADATGVVEIAIERVADAVAALRNEVWVRPEHERRLLPRFRVWAPRAIYPVDAPAAVPCPLEVWLIDLSSGGIGFMSPRPLDAGLEFAFTLPSLEASESYMLCRVLHCRAAPGGSFTTGAQFIRHLESSPGSAPVSKAAEQSAG